MTTPSNSLPVIGGTSIEQQGQRSYYWEHNQVGDAKFSKYDSREFCDILGILYSREDYGKGVIYTAHTSYTGMLEVTNPAGTTIRVASGCALLDGRFYTNSANVDFTIPTAGTYVVVLRANLTDQEVRVAMRGGTYDSQNLDITKYEKGAIIEMTLADIYYDGTSVTITDKRYFIGLVTRGLYLINSTIITGVGQTVDWTSIPLFFNHLIIRGYARSTDNTGGVYSDTVRVRMNNDSGANYDYAYHTKFDTTTSETWTESIGATSIYTGVIPNANADASIFGIFTMDINNYANTTGYKTTQNHVSNPDQAAANNARYALGMGVWKSTNAINRITIAQVVGANFAVGTRFALYGLI